MDIEAVGESLSQLGKAVGPGLIAKAKEMELKPGSVVPLLRDVAHHFFPLLKGDAKVTEPEPRVHSRSRRS